MMPDADSRCVSPDTLKIANAARSPTGRSTILARICRKRRSPDENNEIANDPNADYLGAELRQARSEKSVQPDSVPFTPYNWSTCQPDGAIRKNDHWLSRLRRRFRSSRIVGQDSDRSLAAQREHLGLAREWHLFLGAL